MTELAEMVTVAFLILEASVNDESVLNLSVHAVVFSNALCEIIHNRRHSSASVTCYNFIFEPLNSYFLTTAGTQQRKEDRK